MSEPRAAPAAPDRRTVLWTEAGLLLMAVIWGLNFAVLKYGTTVLEPIAYNATRMTVGTIVLLAVALLTSAAPARADIARLMGLGVLGHGVYQGLFINGLARTRAGSAALVVAASPAVIAIVGRMLGVERISARAVLGIALSFAGIAIVVLGSSRGEEQGAARVTGDLLILASVVAWALYTTFLRDLTLRIDGIQIAAWTLLGGTLPMLVVAAPALARTDWAAVRPLTWAAVAYSGCGAIGFAYLFWYRGVRVIGSTRTAMFSQLQPAVAILSAWPLLGERPTSWQIGGSCAVLGGLLLTRSGAPEPAHGE